VFPTGPDQTCMTTQAAGQKPTQDDLTCMCSYFLMKVCNASESLIFVICKHCIQIAFLIIHQSAFRGQVTSLEFFGVFCFFVVVVFAKILFQFQPVCSFHLASKLWLISLVLPENCFRPHQCQCSKAVVLFELWLNNEKAT